jgi:hypothetical protein
MNCNIIMSNWHFQMSLHYTTSENYNVFRPSQILLSPHTLGGICYNFFFQTPCNLLGWHFHLPMQIEVPFCTFQSPNNTFFHIYIPYHLDNKCIHRFLPYNLCTFGLVIKVKNYVRFPYHVMGSMILDLPSTGKDSTKPLYSI